jgi:imidazolonepropionase-like amidohydrolase
MTTHDNQELLAMSGLRNPYPGKLGVVEEGALADLLLVNGDLLDENTIGVVPTIGIGVTFTCGYEPVKAVSDALG